MIHTYNKERNNEHTRGKKENEKGGEKKGEKEVSVRDHEKKKNEIEYKGDRY